MPVLGTRVRASSDAFAANASHMQSLLDDIRDLEARVRTASSRKRAKFDKRGQLLPRERIARLLDPGSPFLELATLAGLRMHDDDGEESVMGGGSICGIGLVSGRRVAISASDSAIKGGSISPMGMEKGLRLQQIARTQKLPLISLVESGGANLQYQGEMFIRGGRSFANQARMSAAGLPQIAVVHGSSTAGGAYIPGLSDYVIVVRDRTKIFLAGPPLVKSAIGEDTTDEALGGAELHAHTTGLAEYLAEDDGHALAIARDVLDKLTWDVVHDREEATPPAHDPAELLGVVPVDAREPYDVREVIARVVDGSDFLEFKAGYGSETVCGHARIDGHLVAILGNNGPIQPTGSTKAAQFMQLADQAGTPLLFLQNTTGYMVGSAAERDGAVKHGSKMIQAVANARVPKLTVVLGGSFGAGNYGMCGRGFDPDFLFSWPTARSAVMGGAQAAGVMAILAAARFRRMGHADATPEMLAPMVKPLQDQLDAEAHVLFGTARLFDDGVIDPRDTRRVLAFCLATVAEGRRRTVRPNTFGVARM